MPRKTHVQFLGGGGAAMHCCYPTNGLSGYPPPRREAGKDAAPTLSARAHGGGGPGSHFDIDGGLIPSTGDTSRCLNAGGMSRQDYETETLMRSAMAVRRLTPRECERLQGFRDDYTLVEYRGGMASDGPRYKALGNSMAVPVMRWIGQRIAVVDEVLRDGLDAERIP